LAGKCPGFTVLKIFARFPQSHRVWKSGKVGKIKFAFQGLEKAFLKGREFMPEDEGLVLKRWRNLSRR
jgi:hypothetical protein